MHRIIGGGIEIYASVEENEIKMEAYLKVCLGAVKAQSIGGGIVLNPTREFKNAYAGPAIELGAGPFEAAANISPDWPISGGIARGSGFKFTPCWYFSVGGKGW